MLLLIIISVINQCPRMNYVCTSYVVLWSRAQPTSINPCLSVVSMMCRDVEVMSQTSTEEFRQANSRGKKGHWGTSLTLGPVSSCWEHAVLHTIITMFYTCFASVEHVEQDNKCKDWSNGSGFRHKTINTGQSQILHNLFVSLSRFYIILFKKWSGL